MTILIDVARMQWATMRRHPWTVGCIVLCLAGVVDLAVRHGEVPKALAYLGAMVAGVVVVDLFVRWFPTSKELPVRRPQREVLLVLACELLAILALILRFNVFEWSELSGVARMAFMPLMVVMFPILLPIVLWKWNYRPAELGFRWHPACWLFVPILLITAGTAYFIAPNDFTLGALLASEGVIGSLITGLITAGLAEEFVRMALQTRIGAHLRNPAVGWFFATVIWAFLHSPKWYADSGDLYEAVMGAVRIIPLGLLWGYITYRTKSLLPATLVHGFNVWGLQNF